MLEPGIDMLQRVISIKNVGRFQNYSAVGDVTFHRVTSIFAGNGRGKTTLCAILRSLATNDPAIILGRRTLGSVGRPEVHLLFGTGTFTFRDGAWTAQDADIAIFDGVYVSENVFAGDVVDTEHRRNLYRVIIGAPGVRLAGRLNELENLIRAKTTEIRENGVRIQRHFPYGMTVEAFIALPEDAAIDEKIAGKTREQAAVRRVAELRQRQGLATLSMPVFPAGFPALLAKTLANVGPDAGRRVADQLARHRMQAHGEAWLNDGLAHVAGESCAFCGQSLSGNELIRAYQGYFSKEYQALRTEVTDMIRQVESALGDRSAAAIEQTVVRNDAAIEFWREYCALTPPVLGAAGRIAEALTELRTAAVGLLQRKAAGPLEAVPPDAGFTEAQAGFEALRTAIGTYNNEVAAANALIDARKREAQTANIRDVESALATLKAQKARHSDGVRELCAVDVRLHAEKNEYENEKAQAREQLDAHTGRVIEQYGQSINRYLERINAGFRITTPTHTYRGGTPNTSYQILINQNAVELGDAATPTDRPSFKNTLSAGDRSTLALAFFLAQLELDADRGRKVVVFDDPFSSLDSFRRNHTVHQIQRCGETCSQVILLSHEPNFLKLLWDRIEPAERKTLQLAPVGEDNTTLVEWDIEKAVEARLKADIGALQEFFSLGKGEPREVIQKLRPVLEAYCRNLYPTQFLEQDTLGGMVVKIREAGATHPLIRIADDLDEVNIYCRRYHHGEGGNPALEQIDNGELRSYVKRTLGLVGCTC